MRPLGDPVTHYWRTQRMAQVLGVDLVRARKDRQLSSPDWAQSITRCRGCGNSKTCTRWLDSHEGQRPPAPSICENRALFARLCTVD